jgi:excisionase family DNA binding protein
MENSILIRNITAEELQELIRTTVREEFQILSPKKGELRYITRNEAAELLKITLPTLSRYTQLGILKGFRIGTRVLYKLEDIEQDVKSIATSRYLR